MTSLNCIFDAFIKCGSTNSRSLIVRWICGSIPRMNSEYAISLVLSNRVSVNGLFMSRFPRLCRVKNLLVPCISQSTLL